MLTQVSIITLGVGALAAPLSCLAQQKSRVWRVGFLSNRPPSGRDAELYNAFVQGMRELGYVEGKNLAIERRASEARSERLPGLAAELVRWKPDVIVATGGQPVDAAQAATSRIPIVGVSVSERMVKSLARPGGNLTGTASLTPDLSHKHLEMLLSVRPRLARAAMLVDPGNTIHAEILKSARAAAAAVGVGIAAVEARNAAEIAPAFAAASREKADAIIVNGGIFNSHSREIAEACARHALVSISAFHEFTEAGGLMSYGRNLAEGYVRAATFVDKIFKGAKPGDLPIEQPTRFELVINMKTAKALKLEIPRDLAVRADRVIE